MRFLNKKGFTLIELLAVIIVLAVVTLLAVQAILPQVDKARKNAFVVEVNHAIEAAKQWYGTQELENPTSVAGTCACVTIGTLQGGYFETSNTEDYKGFVKIQKNDSTGVMTYTISMTNGSYYVSNQVGKLNTSDVQTAVQSGNTGSNSCTSACS